MSLKFEKDQIYSMPVFFGPYAYKPACNGKPGESNMNTYKQPGDVQTVQVTYETDRELLESMIPECFTLNDPYVSVAVCEFTNLGWACGNTYNLINVNVPVHFKGEQDDLDGDLVLVMFENHGDPILPGRENMGYAKIFADIPRVKHNENKYIATASSLDFRFMKMEIDISKPAPDEAAMKKNEARTAGKINYKYFPDTMDKGEDPALNYTKPAVEYPTILPKWEKPDDYPYTIRTPEIQYCDGTVEFYKPEWEDMPTYYNVGVGLNKLVCKRIIGAKHVKYDDPCFYTPCYRLR